MSSELKQKLIEHFAEENGFDNIRQARSWANTITGEQYQPGTPNAKKLEETIEESVVAVSRNLVRDEKDPLSTYDRLLDLYERQPILGTRTSNSVEKQAYSTPVPIAYLASQMAGIDETKTVYEPSAGNGALLIEANPEKTTVNELDSKRANNLREAGFSPHVGDATQFQPDEKFDVIIENPPFGRVKNDEKQTLSWDVGKYKTKEIDHAIALKSLESLKDNGTAVLIIAGTKETDPEDISNHYNSGQSAPFFKTLYDNYNVTEHFSVDGGLYNRQGAGYPIDIIKVEGRGKSEKPLPAVDIPPKYNSFAELKEVLKDVVLDSSARTNQRGEVRDDSLVLDRSGVTGQYDLHKERTDSPAVTGSEGRETDGTGDSVRGDRQSVQRQGVVGVERSVSEFGETTEGTARSRQGSFDPDALGRGFDNRTSDDLLASTSRTEGDISSISSNRGDGKRSRGINSDHRVERVAQSLDSIPRSTSRHNGLDSDLQATYEPFSQGKRMGGLVPVNMRSTVHKVLGDLVDQVTHSEGVESIDDWVVKKMNEKAPNAKLDSGTWDKERLFNALSAEQIDSVALGIHNFDNNKEFIIGDETGFGKTRQLAALTTYGMQQGFTPVYVTKDDNLYEDVLGGFEEIGVEGVKPYQTNTPKTKQKQHKLETERILASGSLGDKNMVLTTYSQMQTIKGKETDRRNLLRHITAEDGLLIMDECHLAGGSKANVTDFGKAPNGAEFARELKQNAGRTISASATFAKNPEVMDLYSRTSMSKSVDNLNELIDIVSQGGRGLQEILSNQLTESGEYLRRERPFQAEFTTVTLEVDKSLCDAEAEVMDAIVQFDQVKNGVVKDIKKELKAEAKRVNPDATGLADADSTNFTSLMHNYLSVSNLTKKIDAAVDFATDAIQRGEKPCIGVARTVESFIKEYAQDNFINPGDEIDVSFKDMLSHYADKSRDISTRNAYGESSKRRLTDEELGPVGVAAWDNIQKAIDKLEVSNHPISPIDMFKTKMEERGNFVGEITGRSSGIDYVKQSDNSYKAYYKTFPALNEAETKRATTNGFNNGDIDCLIGNKTMSTGISLHSSEKFSDQKQRHFLLLQPEGDINVAKQFFGRFDRTGQVNAPKITIGAANMPYERRVQSNLMGKLSSLSANTTANRESQVDFGETRDFLNSYGDRVAAEIFRENPEINYRLNTPFSEDISYENGGLIKKLTGRLPILSIDEQEKVMGQIETGYDSLMKELDALGTNELKNSTLDLDAVTLASIEVVPAKDDTGSSFTAPVSMDILDVKSGKKPYTSLEVVSLVRKELDLETLSPQTEITPYMLEDTDIEKASRFRSFQEIASIESTRIDYQESRRNLFKTESSAAEFIKTTNNQAEFNKGMQRAFPVGTTIKIDTPNGNELFGVVLKHKSQSVDNKSNPLRPSNNSISIAITGGTKELELPYSKIGSSDDKYSLLPHFEDVQQKDKELSILELFDNNQTDREQRFMMTGNLLNAASKLRGYGRIVHYADSNGERHPGFLMNKDFQPNSLENVPIKLSKVEQIKSFTKEEGLVLHTRDERLNLFYSNRNEQYMIAVPKSKKNGGEFFLDKKLLEAATSPARSETNEFISKGDRSYLYFDDSELKDVVERLDKKWGLFATGKDIAVAKDMVGIEITNFDEVLNQAIKTQQELQEKASISELNLDVDNNESSVDDLFLDIQPNSTQQSVHSETETEEEINYQSDTEVLPAEKVVNYKFIESSNKDLFGPKQLSSNDINSENLSVTEEIPQLDAQPTIDTPGKKGIYQITGNIESTLAVDSVIHFTKKEGWVNNRFKERELRSAIKKVVEDDQLSIEILDTIKNYPEYTQQSVHSSLETEELETESLSTEEIVSDELETESLSTEEMVTEELETKTLSTEEIVNDELETESLSTEEIVNDELETESLSTEEIVSEELELETEFFHKEEIVTEELEKESLPTEEIVSDELETETLPIEGIVTEKLETESLSTEKVVSDEFQNETLPTEEIVTEELETEAFSTEEIVNEEFEAEAFSTEEIVNEEFEAEAFSTEEIVNEEFEKETLPTEEIVTELASKKLAIFELKTPSSSNNTNYERLSVTEEISQIDIQQQRVEYVASITENLLKYVGNNYYEGSEHTAFKDKETNTLTITTTTNNTPLMTAQFNCDTDKWESIDSNLSDTDVSHFQTVQAIVTQRIEDRNNRIQQQEFVELLAPIIADYHDLRADKNPEFGGYSTGWDGENKILTLIDNIEEKEILTAKLNPDGWENINSNLSNWQADELENYFMPELDTNTEELQANRFEKVQPVVADILRNFHTNVYEGKHYFAQWNKDSMKLSAWSNNERQPFLSAHWDKNSGWQDMSDSPISFKIAHHFTEDIQPTLEQYKRERGSPDLNL